MMLKKLGILTFFGLLGCVPILKNNATNNNAYQQAPQQQLPEYQAQNVEQPRLKVPNSVVVCRSKQCAPAKLSTSKEYVYNTLLHMLDSNARKKALVCEADDNTHACTEEYLSIPIKVGVTPAYMYVDDVKITDINISAENTSALDLMLNWNVTYNGQTPICRPSKTLLYVKNASNVIMEDNGYTCKLTTIGTSSIKTLFAIDYIDLDYGYIGGYYSIGMSGPAYGGGSGYMILRLPEDISLDPKDFHPVKMKDLPKEPQTQPEPEQKPAVQPVVPQTQPAPEQTPAVQPVMSQMMPAPEQIPTVQPVMPQTFPVEYAPYGYAPIIQPITQTVAQPVPYAPVAQPAGYVEPQQPFYAAELPTEVAAPAVAQAEQEPEPKVNKTPAPNVDTIIRYNHPSRDYDQAKAEMQIKRQKEADDYAKWKKEQEEAMNYEGVKVLPLPLKKSETAAPTEKNKVGEYNPEAEKKVIPGNQVN